MIKLLQHLAAIAIVMFCTGVAGGASGQFHDNYAIPYHGPPYADPNGQTHVGCYNQQNVRVYESDHFIIYSDIIDNDAVRIKFARMAETEFAANKARLGVTDTELGIDMANISTKLHVCSDGVSSGASGNYTGVSMPALDKSPSNVDPMDLLYCYAGYRNTLRHETVHVIHSILAGNDNLSGADGKSETWFSEGLAVYLSDSSNLSSPGGIILDTGSLAAYFADGRPNPVTVKTRDDMKRTTNSTTLSNSDVYPAFALAVKYLFDSTARGGAGNSLSSLTGLTGMFQQIKEGTTFATAFASTFSKGGVPLTIGTYADNFQTWMTAYLSPLQTPATITSPSGIQMVGIFNYWCDMIIGIGTPVTAGTFALNVSELTDGTYAMCAMTDLETGAGFGPIAVNVSGGKLAPTSYNVSTWPVLSNATIPIHFSGANGTGSINVLSSDVCTWEALSNNTPWLTITAGSSGSGNGTVSYSVEQNSVTPRTGTMHIDITKIDGSIESKTFTVIQAEPCENDIYRIGSTYYSYSTIQDAYNNLPPDNTLQIQALVFTGDLFLGQDKTVTLKGGYGCDFASNTGYTTISQQMTVKYGKVIIERLKIK